MTIDVTWCLKIDLNLIILSAIFNRLILVAFLFQFRFVSSVSLFSVKIYILVDCFKLMSRLKLRNFDLDIFTFNHLSTIGSIQFQYFILEYQDMQNLVIFSNTEEKDVNWKLLLYIIFRVKEQQDFISKAFQIYNSQNQVV